MQVYFSVGYEVNFLQSPIPIQLLAANLLVDYLPG
jgi:hypothetical protein